MRLKHDMQVVEPTHLKNLLVELDHENPRDRGEHKRIFELPPPRILSDGKVGDGDIHLSI